MDMSLLGFFLVGLSLYRQEVKTWLKRLPVALCILDSCLMTNVVCSSKISLWMSCGTVTKESQTRTEEGHRKKQMTMS